MQVCSCNLVVFFLGKLSFESADTILSEFMVC